MSVYHPSDTNLLGCGSFLCHKRGHSKQKEGYARLSAATHGGKKLNPSALGVWGGKKWGSSSLPEGGTVDRQITKRGTECGGP